MIVALVHFLCYLLFYYTTYSTYRDMKRKNVEHNYLSDEEETLSIVLLLLVRADTVVAAALPRPLHPGLNGFLRDGPPAVGHP